MGKSRPGWSRIGERSTAGLGSPARSPADHSSRCIQLALRRLHNATRTPGKHPPAHRRGLEYLEQSYEHVAAAQQSDKMSYGGLQIRSSSQLPMIQLALPSSYSATTELSPRLRTFQSDSSESIRSITSCTTCLTPNLCPLVILALFLAEHASGLAVSHLHLATLSSVPWSRHTCLVLLVSSDCAQFHHLTTTKAALARASASEPRSTESIRQWRGGSASSGG